MSSTVLEDHLPLTLAQASLEPRGNVQPSPLQWRDQILYFLLPDRFSDEFDLAVRPLFDRDNPEQFHATDKRAWMEGGKRFQGGTLKGIKQRLPYLQNMGVTTLWIGPIWKQRADLETYHGYGIQNFLEVDPRFGTRQDLRDLVDAAHALEPPLYVLLDVIINHSGNNWFYDDNGNRRDTETYRFKPPYPFHGFRSSTGGVAQGALTNLEDGVWPKDFQNPDAYTRAGSIHNFDPESWEHPLHPDNQFRRGDFFDLKDLKTNELETGSSKVLADLLHVYRYWIALTDCDGFRIDTVKHVSFDAARHFCGGIREFAESIGKDNFLLLGEVTGEAKMASDYLNIFGRNIDAVLDIGEPTKLLAGLVKGFVEPKTFFEQFGGHDAIGSHRETGRYHVSILDDHDMVGRDDKHRFAANNTSPIRFMQVAHAVGTQLTTLGIPCIYYGTEQAFDGTEQAFDGTQNRHDSSIEPRNNKGEIPYADRYIREVMFGGQSGPSGIARFGTQETKDCHFFDQDHPTYLRIAAIMRLRNRQDQIGMALRRGRQYLRETRVFVEGGFRSPQPGELVAWSRLLLNQEVVVALNTNGQANANRGADVTIDAGLHTGKTTLEILYHSDWTDTELRHPPIGQTLPLTPVEGRMTVRIDLPPGGMVILA